MRASGWGGRGTIGSKCSCSVYGPALPREGEAPADARAAARAAFDPSVAAQAADVMLFAQLYLA